MCRRAIKRQHNNKIILKGSKKLAQLCCLRFKFVVSWFQVYSGYRFAAAAKDQHKPVAILNIGPTRADKLADLKIDAKCGDILPKIRLTVS